MPKQIIAPTKSNLLNLKRDLAIATQGFELLDQKREILVMELMRLLNRVKNTQKKLNEIREKAYLTFKQCVVRNGYHKLRRVSAGIFYQHQIEVYSHVIAGVRVPEIHVHSGQFRSQFGFSQTDSLMDYTMQHFLELLQVIGEMAELETKIWLLARELKKTQRRVNALEQIFIPEFEGMIRYIQESLESKELQEIFVRKLVKKRKQNGK